jgi:hypothetical protein
VFSSFAVYDRILDLIMDKANSIFPNLKRVTIAGHSSGGQIVQRHALFTRVPPPPPTPSAAITATGKASGSAEVTLRHIVSNPSSFAYLDPRRWLPTNARYVLCNCRGARRRGREKKNKPRPLTQPSATNRLPTNACSDCSFVDVDRLLTVAQYFRSSLGTWASHLSAQTTAPNTTPGTSGWRTIWSHIAMSVRRR